MARTHHPVRRRQSGAPVAVTNTPYKSSAMCLDCPRYTVAATLVGRLDGVSVSGVVHDESGKVTGLDGFGNMNLYRHASSSRPCQT